ncbi:hypothetical protein [Lihuaxuella thermophila]|uniref:Uncharacterized protein n=1 Tax=Lihuaxuella thermophila TaxID=1173111 RepID=A0A1H8BKP2_9BACL|nr:hypothetical protein [Lihuaxuella thermophila]SEM82628.1 hypothetical protein SAMN05444955_102203 [Lihuaxuella thermophila]
MKRRHRLILEAYLNLGKVYFEKKEYTLANEILERAERMAKKENEMVKYTQVLLMAKSCLSASRSEEVRLFYEGQ